MKSFLILLASLSFFSLTSPAQTAAQIKTKDAEIRQIMLGYSKQLNVTCTACHKTDNFKSDEKSTFRVAREHMKLTQLLIDNGLDGKKARKADCFMCHRGELKPDLATAPK